ncbi:uncharacterized protein LOC124978710 [Sciurus carolinensis]|uniref:uncharacterized protein LOC124978710 n=1 Tax=Sciurus carolinensis TaxID=30640 RepID=UPI001FB224FD|nr:uncharacterized protein LOC124978710 [Sciurus carolinensis]
MHRPRLLANEVDDALTAHAQNIRFVVSLQSEIIEPPVPASFETCPPAHLPSVLLRLSCCLPAPAVFLALYRALRSRGHSTWRNRAAGTEWRGSANAEAQTRATRVPGPAGRCPGFPATQGSRARPALELPESLSLGAPPPPAPPPPAPLPWIGSPMLRGSGDLASRSQWEQDHRRDHVTFKVVSLAPLGCVFLRLCLVLKSTGQDFVECSSMLEPA